MTEQTSLLAAAPRRMRNWYILGKNGMKVTVRPIHTIGQRPHGSPPNWICRDCDLGFIRLKAAKAHARRAHA